MSEQNSPIKYPLAYIQPDLHEWALYTLYQDKEKLQKAVEQMAVENILKAKRGADNCCEFCGVKSVCRIGYKSSAR